MHVPPPVLEHSRKYLYKICVITWPLTSSQNLRISGSFFTRAPYVPNATECSETLKEIIIIKKGNCVFLNLQYLAAFPSILLCACAWGRAPSATDLLHHRTTATPPLLLSVCVRNNIVNSLLLSGSRIVIKPKDSNMSACVSPPTAALCTQLTVSSLCSDHYSLYYKYYFLGYNICDD